MNLNKAIYDLMENNSSIQFNELLFDYETYEEPPLIHRYIEIEPFKKYLKKEDLNTFLFNLAVTHLNNVKLYAKKGLYYEMYRHQEELETYLTKRGENNEKSVNF